MITEVRHYITDTAAVYTQASSDRECSMCLQRHLSNILKYFLGYRSRIRTRTLTLNPKP